MSRTSVSIDTEMGGCGMLSYSKRVGQSRGDSKPLPVEALLKLALPGFLRVATEMPFRGAATQLQTALANAAGQGADIALFINVVVWNAAIAGGSILGGVLLDYGGAVALPPAVLFLAIIAFSIAHAARTNGFPSGHRR